MLMKTTLKTAKELGLKKDFYQGMLKFRQALKAGEFVDLKTFKNTAPNPCKGLTMSIVLQESAHECRTVGCIMGWSQLFAGDVWNTTVQLSNRTNQHDKELCELICPKNWTSHSYTLDQIEHALDTYLYTGHAEWS